MYVSRSLQRGYNRKEIGLSWSKYQRMKWYAKLNKYSKLYETRFASFHAFQKYAKGELKSWEQYAKKSVKKFIGISVSDDEEDAECGDSDFDL